jgi:hypothetical protein
MEASEWHEKEGKQYLFMEIVEEDGKTYILFNNSEGNLVAKREIPIRISVKQLD